MPDPRFFPPPEAVSVASLAETFGLTVYGDGTRIVLGVAPLDMAGSDDIAFVAGRKHLDTARASNGAVLIVAADLSDALEDRTLLISTAPQRDYARIARHLYPDAEPISGGGAIDKTAKVDPTVSLAPGAVVGSGAEIRPNCQIGPNAVIGAGVVMGQGCRIGANASVSHAVLGDRVRLLPGAAVGQDGFGYAEGDAGLEPIPQLGRVMIGNDVDIGANTTIDRGAGGDTVIGPGTKIDNQVQIGHNCKIGAHCVFVAHAGISGSVTIGNFVQIGGKVGVADHITIGDGAKVAAGSGVIKDIDPGDTHGGYPAQPVRSWHRQSIALARLAAGRKRG